MNINDKINKIIKDLESLKDNYKDNTLHIVKVFKPLEELHRLTKEELLEITKNGWLDYWLASKLICEKLSGRMPTMEELGKLASLLYEGHPSVGAKQDVSDLTYNGKASEFGLPELGFYVWSGEEGGTNGYGAYGRYFYTTYTGWYNYLRNGSDGLGLCLGD